MKEIKNNLLKTLNGSVLETLSNFEKIHKETKYRSHKRFIDRFFKRFKYENEKVRIKSKDRFIRDLIKTYQIYWKNVLLQRKTNKIAEKELFKSLAKFINYNKDINENSYTDIENIIANTLNKKGYHCILGNVLPLRELEIWKNEEVIEYEIEIPEAVQIVKVVFMKDFITKGWEEFATLNTYYPGGWAKTDCLYCNEKAYKDKSSESFLISYLKHEAQHFYDYKNFSNKLKSTDLEYRAKLTELSYANKSLFNWIESFIIQSKNDETVPHSFANFKVISDLSKDFFNKNFEKDIRKWKKLDKSAINNVAKKLIKNSTLRLFN